MGGLFLTVKESFTIGEMLLSRKRNPTYDKAKIDKSYLGFNKSDLFWAFLGYCCLLITQFGLL